MTRWIGTSWKMNKTLAEAGEYAAGLASALQGPLGSSGAVNSAGPEAGLQPFIIPPHTALAAVAGVLGDLANVPGGVRIGAQNAHWEDSGAWTGEISVPQAMDAGATIIEIGHSERREHFKETVETTRLKVEATLRHGAIPLLCIGEPRAVRDDGDSASYILEQARGALSGLSEEQLSRVLIAYEPIWAIGSGGRPARPEELLEPFAALRRHYGAHVEGLLYGGSVTLENAPALLALDDVDGLFVGRAAWELDGYLKLLELGRASR